MSNRIFVGTAATRPDSVGGIYRSRDDGGWDLLGNGVLTDTGVQAITVHPDDADLIFLATRNGIFRTRDGGDSWTKLDVPLEKAQGWSLAIHPTKPSTLVVGASPVAFFRSDDMGDTWRKLGLPDRGERFDDLPMKHSRAMRITIDPKNPDHWYAAVEVNGVLASHDGGETWTDVSENLIELSYLDHLRNHELTKDDTEGMLDGHAVGVSPARPGVVYYACRMGIFTSGNGGKSWEDKKITRFSPIFYSRDIRISPSNPTTLYTCLSISSRSDKGTLFRSDDLGETWRRMDPDVTTNSTIMSMGIHPRDGGKVCAVSRAGDVLFTPNGGDDWQLSKLPAEAGDAFCIACN